MVLIGEFQFVVSNDPFSSSAISKGSSFSVFSSQIYHSVNFFFYNTIILFKDTNFMDVSS